MLKRSPRKDRLEQVGADAEALGRRERGKQDREQRIKAAARAVFVERGYDAATTREIAERADVAVGTVFLYAPDKRDLLFLVLNSELDELVARGVSRKPAQERLAPAAVKVFRVFYEYFGANMELGRYGLREMAFYTSYPLPETAQAKRFRERNDRLIGCIADLVRQSQARGEADKSLDPALVANLLMAIHRAEIWRWLNEDDPDVEAGVKHLGKLIKMVISGLETKA